MLKIYITNLREYAGGNLIGEWADLPLEEEELQEITNRISNNGEDELFISDYETDIGVKINEYDDIYLINEKASIYEYELEEYEREIVYTLVSDGYSFNNALDIKDDCTLYYNCYDMEDVARDYCEGLGIVLKNLERYFDYAAFGDDLGIEHNFIFNDNGNCVQIW